MSLQMELIPKGLKIRKPPAITPVSEDVSINWNKVLHYPKENLVELLKYESSKVILKIQVELDLEVRYRDLENYDRNYKKLNAKHIGFKSSLEEWRGNKMGEKVKAHMNLKSSVTWLKKVQKKWGDSKNNKTIEFSITANKMYVTDNRKAGKRKARSYADVVKANAVMFTSMLHLKSM